MALETGTRIGVYEVTGKLGEGGMGEVYRAHDTTLDRDVALKVLSEAFVADPDRLARFQREAKVLASLNHPNIGGIYGLEAAGESQALVLELIEGPTLADRIATGPIPVDDALAIAIQIAEALDAAHQQGIIHRDLKPANVKLRPDGTVKVLDFGLAKAVTPEANSSASGESPTMSLTLAETQMGMVVGTAAYMAPEQASGEATDKRCDIWAFGVVLIEMLTGTRLFDGKSIAHVMSAVLQVDPDFDALPVSLPRSVATLLRRCLEKDPRRRLRDIGDAFVDLAGQQRVEAEEATQHVALGGRAWLAYGAVALITGAAVAGGAAWMLRPTVEAPVSRFDISAPGLASNPISVPVALSPDGRNLVYTAVMEDGVRRLYQRQLDQLEAVPIRGTEGAQGPFFSPDGEWVGFWTFGEGLLKKVSLTGGPPTTLTPVSGYRWASWGTNGTIVFGGSVDGSGLWQVSDAGGAAQQIVTITDDANNYQTPHFVPGRNAVLFVSFAAGDRPPQVVAHDLDSGEQHVLLQGNSPQVISTGHLLVMREDSLWAVPFDSDRLQLMGEPVPVLEGIQINGIGVGRLSVGANGTLAYVPGAGVTAGQLSTSLVRVDRDGVDTSITEIDGNAWYPRFSPDGSRLAFAIAQESGAAGNADLWVLDIERGTRTRLTFDDNNRFYPVWSPDGMQLAYGAGAGATNRILRTRADGSGDTETVLDIGERQFPMSWSPDGSALAMYKATAETGRDLYILPLEGDGAPEEFLATPFEDRGVSFSPDGKWLAYVSAEAGRDEIYVRPYPGPGGEIVVSNGGGQEAVWSPDGTELFYRNRNQVMVVEIDTTRGFGAEAPRLLFEGDFVQDNAAGGGGNPNFDIAPDGESFVMVASENGGGVGTAQVGTVTVVLNWIEELKERVSGR